MGIASEPGTPAADGGEMPIVLDVEASGLSPSFRIDSLRTLLSESEAAHWQVVKTQVRQELKLRRHRASSDARVLQMTLRRLRMTLPD